MFRARHDHHGDPEIARSIQFGNRMRAAGILGEQHIDRMLEIWQRVEHFKPMTVDGDQKGGERRFLNGPKLTGDGGHSTQSEIDKIFVGS